MSVLSEKLKQLSATSWQYKPSPDIIERVLGYKPSMPQNLNPLEGKPDTSKDRFFTGSRQLAQAVSEFPDRPVREFLQEKGVSPGFAAGAGFAAGILTPLPGGKAKKGEKIAQEAPKVFKGFKDLTTKFLDYSKGKTTLSKQEILDFARRPELKKGEADLLNKLGSEIKEGKIPAQEFADSIKQDLLPLKPVRVKDPQYQGTTLQGRGLETNIRRLSPEGKQKLAKTSNYEEVVFESPITTNGSSHYPNSKNYFAHARGDEVVEGGKKIWREQEIQSDLLRKDVLESQSRRYKATPIEDTGNELITRQFGNTEVRPVGTRQKEIDQLSPFTNDRFGERIMRERIKEKAKAGYSKYRIPTGETIGKIEGFEVNTWRYPQTGKVVTSEDLAVDQIVEQNGQSYVTTDILGNGRFKAVPKDSIKFSSEAKDISGEKWNQEWKSVGEKVYPIGAQETFDFTGKSNPQYRRYTDWGKFLKNKFGGREVTDAQGNTWVEIDLKPKYKNVPIEAFGVAPLLLNDEEHVDTK